MDHCCFAGCKLVTCGKCKEMYCATTFHICEPKEEEDASTT